MRHSIKAYIHKGEKYYVAECLEIAVVTQGKTLDETIANLKEAVTLHLEGEDLAELDLAN
jgi:predicted RNase H-like HicB family nuclease